MSFTGDLEHLPIVDVIQLLHSTRKSGVLQVHGRKGESRLVFKDGFIVSASHLNNSVRIGDILVGRSLLTREALEQAIEEQKQAGDGCRPLLVTLLEKNLLGEKDAYSALRSLIELTIVEILTWKTGAFSLEMGRGSTSDDYGFYPEDIYKEITIDTQGILMDALRVFDEKRRDGELADDQEAGEEPTEEEESITAEDLGLADLEQLDCRAPAVFKGLDDPAAAPHVPQKNSGNPVRSLNEVISALPATGSIPGVALAVLTYVAEFFDRASTLVVHKSEVAVEREIGVRAPGNRTATPPPGVRIPLAESPLLREAIASGRISLGEEGDPGLQAHFYSRLVPPAGKTLLLFPVKAFGKTVFLILGDFGDKEEKTVPVELLEMLGGQASLALENLVLRKKMNGPSS